MRVLVACEESQTVCQAFRERGDEAFSCDIQDQSGGHPEWHIRQDVLPLLNGGCRFFTTDGAAHAIMGKWDLLIAHPPCTHLAVSGACWFANGKKPRWLQDDAASFFMMFINADCDHIAVENPIGVMSTRFRKPDQIIHPYQFGHKERKSTCLWLKGLPKLVPTDDVYEEMLKLPKREQNRIHWLGGGHSKERSKTFQGIAEAMSDQWRL